MIDKNAELTIENCDLKKQVQELQQVNKQHIYYAVKCGKNKNNKKAEVIDRREEVYMYGRDELTHTGRGESRAHAGSITLLTPYIYAVFFPLLSDVSCSLFFLSCSFFYAILSWKWIREVY